jgi:hypothetical protein
MRLSKDDKEDIIEWAEIVLLVSELIILFMWLPRI